MDSIRGHSRTTLRPLPFAALAAVLLAPGSAALANGCLPGYQQYYPCLAGDTSNGTIRNSVATPTLNSVTFLNQFAGAGARPQATAAGASRVALGETGETGAAGAAGAPRWNAWLAAGQNEIAYSFAPARSSGTAKLFLGGIEYTYASNIVAGVAVNTDRTRSIFQANLNSPMTVDGYSIAPYLSVPFARNWLFDASVGFGEARIKITDYNAPAEGNTKSDRFFTSLAVSYAARMGAFDVVAKANLVETQDKIASFTMTDRTFVRGNTVRVLQSRLGVQATYNAGMFAPFIGVTWINDMQAPKQAAFLGQTPANDRDSAQITAGINIVSRGALSGGVLVSTETARSQVKNNVFLANLSYRF